MRMDFLDMEPPALDKNNKSSLSCVSRDGRTVQLAFSAVSRLLKLQGHVVVTGSDAEAVVPSACVGTTSPGFSWIVSRSVRVLPHSRSIKPFELKKRRDRKSTRLNSSHVEISYAVF